MGGVNSLAQVCTGCDFRQDFQGFVPEEPLSGGTGNYYPQTGYFNITGYSTQVVSDNIAPTPNLYGLMHANRTPIGIKLETILIPLQNPIDLNCTVTISFQANGQVPPGGQDLLLQFFALNGQPTVILNDSQMQNLLCDASFSIGSIPATAMLGNCGIDIANDITGTIASPPPVLFDSAPTYSFTWTNNTSLPVTAIWLAPATTGGFVDFLEYNVFIDNIVIHNQCLSQISTSSNASTVVVCPNQTAQVTYNICADNCLSAPTAFTAQAILPTPIPAGVSIQPNASFNSAGSATFTLSAGQCQTLDLLVTNGDFAPLTSFNVTMTLPVNTGLYCTNTTTTQIITDNLPTCCQMNNVYFLNNSFNYTAPIGSGTWIPWYNPLGTPARINGDIIIPSGATVEVEGMNFEFGPNGRILVQPGGELTLTDCILTGNLNCQTMWQGIRVYKNSAGQRGILHLEDFDADIEPLTNTVIRDALIGVADANLPVLDLNQINNALVALPDFNVANNLSQMIFNFYSLDILASYGGDIPTPVRTNFENCFIGISNHLNTEMSIGKCTFSTTIPNLYFPFNMLTQGETGIEGILGEGFMIRECQFDDLKYGIRTNVFNDFEINHSVFNNCRKGISCRNMFVQPEHNVKIGPGNGFNDCTTAIQGQSINAKIYSNTISSSQSWPQPTGSYTDYRGILLMGSDFTVKENIINNATVGITIVNSHTDAPVIHGNVIENTQVGISVIGKNPKLIIECNDLLNYQNGAITLVPHPSLQGTLSQQGACNFLFPDMSRPAANKFVRPTNTSNLVFGDLFCFLASPYTYCEFNNQLPAGFSFSSGPTQVNFQSCAMFAPTTYSREARCAATEPQIAAGDVHTIVDDTEKDQAISEWIKYYNEQDDKAAIETLLDGVNTEMTTRLKVQYYFDVWSDELLNQLLDGLSKNEEEGEYFDYFYKLLLTLRQENRSIFEITEAEEGTLLEIANSETPTAFRAQALLYVAKGYEFSIELPDLIWRENSFQTFFKANTALNAGVNCLYPNPAMGQLSLNYSLNNQDNKPEQGALRIYNAGGMLIYSQALSGTGNLFLDSHNFEAGLYFYEIVSQSSPITRNKLLIIR